FDTMIEFVNIARRIRLGHKGNPIAATDPVRRQIDSYPFSSSPSQGVDDDHQIGRTSGRTRQIIYLDILSEPRSPVSAIATQQLHDAYRTGHTCDWLPARLRRCTWWAPGSGSGSP